jgi:hypothetical protein
LGNCFCQKKRGKKNFNGQRNATQTDFERLDGNSILGQRRGKHEFFASSFKAFVAFLRQFPAMDFPRLEIKVNGGSEFQCSEGSTTSLQNHELFRFQGFQNKIGNFKVEAKLFLLKPEQEILSN